MAKDGSTGRSGDALGESGPGLGLAMEFGAAVVGFALVGWLIDRWAGTLPLWTAILAGVGVIGGGYNLVRQAMAMNKEMSERYRREHGGKRANTGRGDPASGQAMFGRREIEIEEGEDGSKEPDGFREW